MERWLIAGTLELCDRVSVRSGCSATVFAAKEMSEVDPTPELPDDTPISDVRLPTRI
jgi:hypothetical protein